MSTVLEWYQIHIELVISFFFEHESGYQYRTGRDSGTGTRYREIDTCRIFFGSSRFGTDTVLMAPNFFWLNSLYQYHAVYWESVPFRYSTGMILVRYQDSGPNVHP